MPVAQVPCRLSVDHGSIPKVVTALGMTDIVPENDWTILQEAPMIGG